MRHVCILQHIVITCCIRFVSRQVIPHIIVWSSCFFCCGIPPVFVRRLRVTHNSFTQKHFHTEHFHTQTWTHKFPHTTLFTLNFFCTNNSFTRNFVTHVTHIFFHTQACTHTHKLPRTTLLHTPLSHTTLSHIRFNTQHFHTHTHTSFTRSFVTNI